MKPKVLNLSQDLIERKVKCGRKKNVKWVENRLDLLISFMEMFARQADYLYAVWISLLHCCPKPRFWIDCLSWFGAKMFGKCETLLTVEQTTILVKLAHNLVSCISWPKGVLWSYSTSVCMIWCAAFKTSLLHTLRPCRIVPLSCLNITNAVSS